MFALFLYKPDSLQTNLFKCGTNLSFNYIFFFIYRLEVGSDMIFYKKFRIFFFLVNLNVASVECMHQVDKTENHINVLLISAKILVC